MKKRFLTMLALLSVPSVAQADVRATYSDGSVIEINDEGAMRGNLVSEGKWLLHVEGADYLLVNDGGAIRVLDPVIVEQVANTYTPELFTMILGEVPPLAAHPVGDVMIDGRPATGYRIDDERNVSFAISNDPSLSRIGEAITHQFRIWTFMQGPLGSLAAPLADMLASGTAVRVGNVDLVSVEEVEIDETNFAVPGEPLDWFATEEVMLRLGLIKVG